MRRMACGALVLAWLTTAFCTNVFAEPRSTVIGTSQAGAPLTLYQLGDGPRRVLLIGGQHGGPEQNTVELANGLLDSRPELGEELLAELARARLADGDELANTVQMGSTVTYEAEGRTRQVTLVYPAQANIDGRAPRLP